MRLVPGLNPLALSRLLEKAIRFEEPALDNYKRKVSKLGNSIIPTRPFPAVNTRDGLTDR